MLTDIVRGLWGSFRETLPSTEQEAGAFLSGMLWAFAAHWGMLIFVTYAYTTSGGGRP